MMDPPTGPDQVTPKRKRGSNRRSSSDKKVDVLIKGLKIDCNGDVEIRDKTPPQTHNNISFAQKDPEEPPRQKKAKLKEPNSPSDDEWSMSTSSEADNSKGENSKSKKILIPERKVYIFPTAELRDGNLHLCPVFTDDEDDSIDCKSLLAELHKHNGFWPRSGSKPLSKICADFARSYHITAGGAIDIPLAVHKYCYMSEGKITPEERKAYLALICLDDKMHHISDDHTPERGCFITRVKFEMTSAYIQMQTRCDKQTSDQLAMLALYKSTQDYLGWIKHSALNALRIHFPDLMVAFAFYQTNINCENGKVMLEVKLINYIPKNGAWPCKQLVPDDNKKMISVLYQYDLRTPVDRGTMDVYVDHKKAHKRFKKKPTPKDKKKFTGVYNAPKKCSIKYCDTMPTW